MRLRWRKPGSRRPPIVVRFTGNARALSAMVELRIAGIPRFGQQPGHGSACDVLRYLTFWFDRLEDADEY